MRYVVILLLMKYLNSVFLLFVLSLANAQSPAIQWQKCFGGSNSETGNSIKITSDGGYILAGSSNSVNGDVTQNFGGVDYWIVKMNSVGTIQWKKSYGGSGDDYANSVQQTFDGGYIVAGTSNSNNGHISNSHGNNDFWIIKLDSTGNLIWQKSLGGTSNDSAQSVQQTTDGGYIVAGSSSSNNGDVSANHGYSDFWILKLNSTGNIIWEKSLGGSGADEAMSVRQTSEGGYIIAGYTNSSNGNVTQNFGGSDYWIIKLNSLGNLEWEKSIGNLFDDVSYSAEQTMDGGYIVAGATTLNSESGVPDYRVLKLNSAGGIEWSRYFGGNAHDNGQEVRQTPDGGYIVGGWTVSNNGDVTGNHGIQDFWLVKLNSQGSLVWQKTLGGIDVDAFSSLEVTPDNGYIVAGYTMSNSGDVSGNHGAMDAWVVKLNPEQLGVSESIHTNQILMYPNPAKNFFYLDHLPADVLVDVTDVSGRKVFSEYFNTEKIKINTSEFTNGTYIVGVKKKNGTFVFSEKIIISK